MGGGRPSQYLYVSAIRLWRGVRYAFVYVCVSEISKHVFATGLYSCFCNKRPTSDNNILNERYAGLATTHLMPCLILQGFPRKSAGYYRALLWKPATDHRAQLLQDIEIAIYICIRPILQVCPRKSARFIGLFCGNQQLIMGVLFGKRLSFWNVCIYIRLCRCICIYIDTYIYVCVYMHILCIYIHRKMCNCQPPCRFPYIYKNHDCTYKHTYIHI